MPITTRGYPYPSNTDAPAGPAQIQALAAAVDTDMAGQLQRCARVMGRTSTLSVTDSTFTAINSYPDALTNVGDIAYSVGVYTVATAGVYRWDGTVFIAAGTTGRLSLLAYVNGVRPTYRNGGSDTGLLSGGVNASTGGPLVLAAGDQVQMYVYQSSGATQTVTPYLFALERVA